MVPPASAVNFTPSSRALVSVETSAGVADALQIEHGQLPKAAVANDHTTSLASALPAASLTPLAPPLIVAVYVVAFASGAVGVRVAVTVAAPRIGCPTPLWPEADMRANRVLEAFLTPDQLVDYRRHGAFVAVGADTGRRYVITNRERPGMAQHFEFRSIYDVDGDRPLCVHDWDVPPPEEMLALKLCVELPGREYHIRRLAGQAH